MEMKFYLINYEKGYMFYHALLEVDHEIGPLNFDYLISNNCLEFLLFYSQCTNAREIKRILIENDILYLANTRRSR